MLSPKPNTPATFSTQEELEDLLVEGLASGEPVAVTPEFWRDLELQLKQRKTSRRKAS